MIWPQDEFTRFEVSRLLGSRALQISLGAPVLIKTKETSPLEIAKDEFKNQAIPITIKRTMPDSTKVAVEAKKAIKNWMSKYNQL